MFTSLHNLHNLCTTSAQPIYARFLALQCGISATAQPAQPKTQYIKCTLSGCIHTLYIYKHSCNEVTAKRCAGCAAPQKVRIPPWFLLHDLGRAEVVQQYEQEAA